MDFRFELRLPLSEEAPFAARRSVEAAAPFVKPRVLEDLRLLISELVTNSVMHARNETSDEAWIEVRLKTTDNAIQAEVTDRGPGFDRPTQYREMGEGGRGLFLLNKIASRWEVFHDGVNNHVSFEVKDPGERSSSR